MDFNTFQPQNQCIIYYTVISLKMVFQITKPINDILPTKLFLITCKIS